MNPSATNHPISWVKKYHDDKALDLSPVFQRKAVWSDSQASYLIDSILNDLPVPEIFVRTATSAVGETVLEVVDGQQRLRSIIRFYSNDLELLGDDVTPRWAGTTWDDLSPDQKKAFFAFKLIVRELEGATDAEVRDMFRRLNASQSSLNDQELRHSQFQGEFISLVEALADDDWWVEHKVVTPSQIRRMADVEFISELLVSMMSGPLDKKQGLEEFYVDYDDDFPDRDHWRDQFLKTRRLSLRLAGDELRGWRSKTEFYSLFLASAWLRTDDQVPSSKRMPAAIKRLKTFREKVNKAKRKDNTETFEPAVHEYAEAAVRASTDLARRRLRSQVIQEVVTGKLKV
ncbi:MAG: DUF262 domain-containing protein [bacterium]|nr:DUF262 domain-containing protein [bacterium]